MSKTPAEKLAKQMNRKFLDLERYYTLGNDWLFYRFREIYRIDLSSTPLKAY